MAENNLTGRSALIRLSRQYGGKWAEVYRGIKDKDPGVLSVQDPTPEELHGWIPITLLDDGYPQRLKESNKPPFVVYCKGDLSLLAAQSLLYVCENRPGNNQHPAVDNLIWDIAREGIVPIVCWRPIKGGGQLATVLAAHETNGKPLIVLIPASAKDPDKLGDRIAAFGGLAIRESFPGSERELRVEEDRIAAALCSACLVVGGDKGANPTTLLSYALYAGKDAGAVAYAMGDPDGYLPTLAAKEGALLVDSMSDVRDLLGGE